MYQSPQSQQHAEIIVKRSRFIAYVNACSNKASASDVISSISRRYPDARHICWAFVCGTPGNYSNYGFSDDGEPVGTAGKPILNVIQHKPISDLCIVVVRYFGGIKLGAGGLVRAYSGAANQALEKTPMRDIIAYINLKITLPYALEDRLRRLIADSKGNIIESTYGHIVEVQCRIPAQSQEEFINTALEIGKGLIGLSSTSPHLPK
jgi:uncharacterized YigZ family protein